MRLRLVLCSWPPLWQWPGQPRRWHRGCPLRRRSNLPSRPTTRTSNRSSTHVARVPLHRRNRALRAQTYAQARRARSLISHAVGMKHMPPWCRQPRARVQVRPDADGGADPHDHALGGDRSRARRRGATGSRAAVDNAARDPRRRAAADARGVHIERAQRPRRLPLLRASVVALREHVHDRLQRLAGVRERGAPHDRVPRAASGRRDGRRLGARGFDLRVLVLRRSEPRGATRSRRTSSPAGCRAPAAPCCPRGRASRSSPALA